MCSSLEQPQITQELCFLVLLLAGGGGQYSGASVPVAEPASEAALLGALLPTVGAGLAAGELSLGGIAAFFESPGLQLSLYLTQRDAR